MRAIRDALLVASFDLFESVRSRKFLALLVLHVLGAVVSTLVFVKILAEFETVLATQLGVAETAKPGTMTEELMNSPETLEVLTGLMQDAELAKELVSVPPLALFYGWIALFVLPALVVFVGVLLGLLLHPLHLGVRQTAGGLDANALFLVGALVLGRHVEDAVGVDVEGHLDLRHAPGRRRDTVQVEAAQGPVVRRHVALAL